MAENKTKLTEADVDGFIAAVPDPRRREDARTLCAMMTRISGERPQMWGPSIIGFGTYHYRYESGREGDSCEIGFSPRASALTLYLGSGFPGYDALMERLGKHKTSKACLYINKLADVDMAVLEELVAAALAHCRSGAGGSC